MTSRKSGPSLKGGAMVEGQMFLELNAQETGSASGVGLSGR